MNLAESGGMLKIGRSDKKRGKLPWYDYVFGVVAVVAASQIDDWLAGLNVLVVVLGTIAGGFVAGYLVWLVAKWASRRFPALNSEHTSYFDR